MSEVLIHEEAPALWLLLNVGFYMALQVQSSAKCLLTIFTFLFV